MSYCNNGHKLISCTMEQLIAYSNKTYRRGCICDRCKQTIENTSYHCKSCYYDLCTECYVPSNETIKDNNEHILNAYYAPWRKWYCSECQQRYGKRELLYYCNLCDYGACAECFNQKLSIVDGEGQEGERGEEEEKQTISMEQLGKLKDCEAILNYLQDKSEFDELWKIFDRDGNGHIDDDELDQILYTALITFGQEFEPGFVDPNKEECKDVINSLKKEVKDEIDTNDDGVISKKEFKLYAKNLKQEYNALCQQRIYDANNNVDNNDVDNNDINNNNNNNNNNDEDRIDIKRSVKRGVNSGIQETVKGAIVNQLVAKGIGLISLWLGNL